VKFTESEAEAAALAWLEATGWTIVHGPAIAPGEPLAERDDHGEAMLVQLFHSVLLPKLIRGKIRVKDAERFLKERGL